jgi:hypothetical protein
MEQLVAAITINLMTGFVFFRVDRFFTLLSLAVQCEVKEKITCVWGAAGRPAERPAAIR